MRYSFIFSLIPVTSLLILLSSCIKEGTINRPYSNFRPVQTNDGWQVSGPAAENMDSAQLDLIYRDLYADDKAWALSSMLVFRNGKLVAESYLKSENDRGKKITIWSCTKQVTALATGIAIDEGFIGSVNDPISLYLPEVAGHPDKKDITISNLLTMRSGIFFDNGTESDIFRKHKTKSSLEYVLGNELKWQPGSYYQYNDGAAQLMSGIIQYATGMTLADYAKDKIFSRIGLADYEWFDYSDGVTLGAFGILMPPRELAKIARCVCDSGTWNGEQVIPREWLRQALTIKVPGIHENIGFGYFWWVNEVEGYVFMWGHGGQYAIIYPEKKLVVVITGLEQVDDDAAFWYQKALSYSNRIAGCAD
jgi:CubicO group peptidase (beta-lactamase class C family)